jgi:3-oxoacyl-[acyl-carrier protein] reductase
LYYRFIIQQFTTIIFKEPTLNIQQIFLRFGIMDLSLRNKTAIVCGSTQGIGLASAIELAKLGATCVLMARTGEALKTAVSQLDISADQKHSYIVADFDKPETVRSAIESFLPGKAVPIISWQKR